MSVATSVPGRDGGGLRFEVRRVRRARRRRSRSLTARYLSQHVVDITLLFTTDPAIHSSDLVQLEDDHEPATSKMCARSSLLPC